MAEIIINGGWSPKRKNSNCYWLKFQIPWEDNSMVLQLTLINKVWRVNFYTDECDDDILLKDIYSNASLAYVKEKALRMLIEYFKDR